MISGFRAFSALSWWFTPVAVARGRTRWVRRVQGAQDDASLRPWASGGDAVRVAKSAPFWEITR